MFETSWTMIFFGIVIFGLILLIVLMIRAFFTEIKESSLKCFASTCAWYHKFSRKYGVIVIIIKKLRQNELSYSVDVVFQLFCNFYDVHKVDMETWAFDKHLFPEGRREMSDMYRWIKKVRSDNYSNANNVVQSNGHIEYFGVPYKGFKSRINAKGELVVSPHDEDDPFIFERVTMRMYNALYKLDTEKCMWILERRKHFGF